MLSRTPYIPSYRNGTTIIILEIENCTSFNMVNMVSGMDHGCVHPMIMMMKNCHSIWQPPGL